MPAASPRSSRTPEPSLPMAASAPAVNKQIVIPITISFSLGDSFQKKLPFLLGLLLFFSFAMVMFEKSNLKTTDLSDLQRVQYNIPKLYSFSFILFMILFAFTLALAVYYSISLGWVPSLLVVPVVFIPAILLGLIAYPGLLMTFLGLAIVVTFSAVIASLWDKYSLSRAWSLLSLAMLLFSICAFLVVFGKVAENKDAHIDLFLDTLVSQAQSGGSIPISGQMVSSAVTKDDFGTFITENQVRELLVNTYPTFATLSENQKTALVTTTRNQMVELGYSSFQKNSGAVAQSISQRLTQLLSGGPQAVKQQIYALPQFKVIYDHFSLFAAAIAALVASSVGFFIELLALGFLFLLHLLLPQPRR